MKNDELVIGLPNKMSTSYDVLLRILKHEITPTFANNFKLYCIRNNINISNDKEYKVTLMNKFNVVPQLSEALGLRKIFLFKNSEVNCVLIF